MSPINIIVILAVVALCGFAVYRVYGIAAGKKGCCSDEGTGVTTCNTEQVSAADGPEDKDESHYPYVQTFEIGGMTCQNCVNHVTRALNSIEGTWAQVTLAGGQARILSKNPIDVDAYRAVVEKEGYRLLAQAVTKPSCKEQTLRKFCKTCVIAVQSSALWLVNSAEERYPIARMTSSHTLYLLAPESM